RRSSRPYQRAAPTNTKAGPLRLAFTFGGNPPALDPSQPPVQVRAMSSKHLRRGGGAHPRPTPSSLALASRSDQWTVLYGLLPMVWPKGRPDLRLRVVLAFGVLVL